MRRHRRWRTVLVVLLVVALAGGAGWVVGWSDLLALEADEVTVSGQGSTVDADRVREIAVAPAGTPLVRVDTAAMSTQILDLRGVKDVEVSRSWPHGLQVRLTAREPVAAVPDEDGYVLLDDEEVRVGTRSKVPEGLPVVSVPLDDGAPGALTSALAVVAALPTGLASQVEEVTARTQDDVETALQDGVRVQWGGREDLELKVEVVRTLRDVAGDATIIDVSSPTMPVTR